LPLVECGQHVVAGLVRINLPTDANYAGPRARAQYGIFTLSLVSTVRVLGVPLIANLVWTVRLMVKHHRRAGEEQRN
jgi:hypothetical protein